jgi:hypothetical protein
VCGEERGKQQIKQPRFDLGGSALQSAPLPALSFTALYYQLGKPQASATKGIIRRSKNISLRV